MWTKITLHPDFTLYIKIYSILIRDLMYKKETWTFLVEYIVEQFLDITVGKNILSKEKTYYLYRKLLKFDYIKITSIVHQKTPKEKKVINKVTLFIIYTTAIESAQTINKEFKSVRNNTTMFLKMRKSMKRLLIEEKSLLVNKYMNNKHKHITSINDQENSKDDKMKCHIIPHNFTNVQTLKLKAVRLFRNKNL